MGYNVFYKWANSVLVNVNREEVYSMISNLKHVKRTRKMESILLEIGNQYKEITVNSIVKKSLELSTYSNYVKVINSKVVIQRAFFEKKVKNVYRFSIKKKQGKLRLYYFIEKDNEFINSKYNDQKVDVESHLESILLILESPHKNEFDENFNPIAPAQGDTGDFIYEEIIQVLMIVQKDFPLKEGEEYRLLIANPVTCQTSMNYLHKEGLKSSYKTLRDKVWITLWENEPEFQNQFRQLISLTQPIIVLNACTFELKPYINKFVETYIPGVQLFSINHPAAWWQGHNIQKV